jgi:hypothetical protein
MSEMKLKWLNKTDGQWIDEDEVVEDGGTVHVPLMLCDSMAGQRSGYALLTADQVAKRQEARDGYIRDLNSAWRMDAKRKPPDDDTKNDNKLADVRAPAIKARDSYVRYLMTAWRRPVRDAAQPDNSSSAEVMRRHLYGATDPNAAPAIERQAERERGKGAGTDDPRSAAERSYDQYKASLATAWQTTGPPNYYTKQRDPGLGSSK